MQFQSLLPPPRRTGNENVDLIQLYDWLRDLHTAATTPDAPVALVSAAGQNVTYSTAELGRFVLRSNRGSWMIDTLPGTDLGLLPTQGVVDIHNADASGLLVIEAGPGTSIDGLQFIILGPRQSVSVWCDGGIYRTRGRPDRFRLAAETAFYFDPVHGLNTNNGVTPETPWATLQHGWDYWMGNVDVAGQQLIGSLADGTYGRVACNGTLTGLGFLGLEGATGPINQQLHPVKWRGNNDNPERVIVDGGPSSAIKAYHGPAIALTGLTLKGTIGAASYNGSYLAIFDDVIFGECLYAQLNALYGGEIEVLANYTIDGSEGNGPYHARSDLNGFVINQGHTIKLTGAPTFSDGFLAATDSGTVQYIAITTDGSIGAMSKKYVASGNGVIDTGGGSWTIPGAVAGTTATGGQFS